MESNFTLGIDISKHHLDYVLLKDDYQLVESGQIKNMDKTVRSFLLKLVRSLSIQESKLFVCCENTGIYNRPLERVCVKLGLDLWVEHALKIKFASTKMRGKTDREDAQRIAEYGIRYRDRAVLYQEPSAVLQKLKHYLKVRETLLKQQVSLKNQLREAKSHDELEYKVLKASYRPMLNNLSKLLKDADCRIQELSQCEPEIARNMALVTSIPGLGTQNALQLIIHTENFTRFNTAKHLACYAGVVPFQNQSGTIQKPARVSRMANQELKKLLHLGAMSAIRYNQELKAYYTRKVSEGKNKMCVLNAVRNKLIHRVYAVIQRQEPYQAQLATINRS